MVQKLTFITRYDRAGCVPYGVPGVEGDGATTATTAGHPYDSRTASAGKGGATGRPATGERRPTRCRRDLSAIFCRVMAFPGGRHIYYGVKCFSGHFIEHNE